MGSIPGEDKEPDGSREWASAFDDVARVTDSGEAEGASLRRAGLYIALDVL